MMIRSIHLITAVAAWLLSFRSVIATPTVDPTQDYSFDQFVLSFGKVYSSEQEREARHEIFQANLHEILAHNIQNNKLAIGGYKLGINEWTDRQIPDELPLGLQKKATAAQRGPDGGLFSKQSSVAETFYQEWLPTVVPVSDLPNEVDWRTHNPKVTSPVKQQGFCGSCWAVAATAVLESHIALQTGQLYTLSPQELVSCVENPEHCGGGGGCTGATYELAFEYVVKHGMVPESEFPYKSGRGSNVKCSLANDTHQEEDVDFLLRGSNDASSVVVVHDGDSDGFIDGAVASIQGYVNFPTNNYTTLMNAVATLGPIGVTVAANRWSFYMGGVFSMKKHNTTDATDVNHAVVLEGYGIDQETQEPYWLVRNSWGSLWGEGGYIRLLRVDPSTLPDFDSGDCGIDTTPSDGAGCTKDKDGNDIIPKPIKVCGTSAILYDTFVPIGGRLLPARNRGQATPLVAEEK